MRIHAGCSESKDSNGSYRALSLFITKKEKEKVSEMDTYTGYLDTKEKIEPTKDVNIPVIASILSGLAMAGLSILKK